MTISHMTSGSAAKTDAQCGKTDAKIHGKTHPASHAKSHGKVDILPPENPVQKLQRLLGSEPMLEGEDAAAYLELLDDLTLEIDPKTIIEAILVRELAGVLWIIERTKKMKANLFATDRGRGAEALLRGNGGHGLTNIALSQDFARGDQKAVDEICKILKKRGLTMEVISVLSYAENTATFEALDRLQDRLGAAREKLMVQIERYGQRRPRPDGFDLIEASPSGASSHA